MQLQASPSVLRRTRIWSPCGENDSERLASRLLTQPSGAFYPIATSRACQFELGLRQADGNRRFLDTALSQVRRSRINSRRHVRQLAGSDPIVRPKPRTARVILRQGCPGMDGIRSRLMLPRDACPTACGLSSFEWAGGVCSGISPCVFDERPVVPGIRYYRFVRMQGYDGLQRFRRWSGTACKPVLDRSGCD